MFMFSVLHYFKNIDKGMETYNELEATMKKLEEANLIISDNKDRLTKQNETITEIGVSYT